MNHPLSTSQAVSHPHQDIGKVRKVAFFYLFQLNIYFRMSANVFTSWPSHKYKQFVKKCVHAIIFSIFPQVKHNWIITMAALFSRQLVISTFLVIFIFSFQSFCLLWSLKKTSFWVSRETENSLSLLITLQSSFALVFTVIWSTSLYWRRRRKSEKKQQQQQQQTTKVFEKRRV